MSQSHLRKYNQATTINFNLFNIDGVDMSIAATFAAGDIKIMKDEGAEANTGSTPTDEGSGYSLALTATEMSAARIMIHLIDQTATKVWLDTSIVIETYGNASASHAFDLGTASTPQTADHAASIASILTDTAEIGTAGAGLSNIGTIATVTTLTNKTGFSLASTGLDAIVSTATGMVEIAKAIWDRLLTGATHNINNSAGKRLRQLATSFVVDSGTAQAGSTTTITLAATASAVDDIYNGDRVIIVGGTGMAEHDIIIAYNGTTKVATVAQTWVTIPDNTSDYELTPATVDIETWQHKLVTTSASGLPDVNVNEVADTTQTAGDLSAQNITAQADLDIITGANGVVLLTATQASIDAIEVDTGTTIPATITTLQADSTNLLLGVIFGTAATGTLSTTQATTDLTGYTASQLIGRTIIVTSGQADGEGSDITAYSATNGTLTFTAMTLAMGNTDTFKIV